MQNSIIVPLALAVTLASRPNKNRLVSLAEIVLIFVFTSCGYTILKTETREKDEEYVEFHEDDNFIESPESMTADEKLMTLCSTWRGIIVTEIDGDAMGVDTVYAFSLYRDGTWVFDGELGFFEGYWTFEDNRNGFFLNLHCTLPEWKFYQSCVGYFRHWGLQLYTSFAWHHKRLVWNLTQ